MPTPSIWRARGQAGALLRGLLCGATLLATPAQPAQGDQPGIAFSALRPGAQLPADWKNLPVVHGKALTRYSLVTDGATTVLQADASASASALMHEGDIDLSRTPVVSWRWKAQAPVEGANNSEGSKEDAPARLVFFFDGDKDKLAFGDRASIQLAKRFGGEDLPYATLMYIWSTTAAPGSVIPNPHTGRVQMIVVSGRPGDAGQWQNLRRNIAQDYEQVFHEPPGKITGYGLLTDTDNTGATTRAWYGDLRFLPAR